ncbi:MAG: hypothetical protein FWC67_03430, partial [Defluviitaleaceae bacterium]|nr:hypothetical protein [Defluviitaleaceae bacterium]
NRDGVIIIGNLPLLAERGMTLALPKNISIYDVDIELILPDRLTAPVAENFPAGSVIARYNGQILDSVDIMTARGGTALSAEALTAVAVAQGASAGYEQLPQNFLAALLGNYDFQYLPEWLESLDTISIVLAVIAIVISLILAIKFLKFKKPRSKRGRYKNHSKKFKSNIAKNYKYR